MCGFAGMFDLEGGGAVCQRLAVAMAERLVHRGPDSSGSWSDERCAVGFRRLSIVDLDHGEQPMTNEDGSLVLVANGEIFNYKELRRELLARGHVFATACDVEVLLHLYEEEGRDLLGRLNGQFAFALYDRRERSLLLARDHFGVVPLFYCRTGGLLLFASEVKSLLAHPAAPREVDPAGLDQVLSFPGLVSPRTMFRGVESLKPGSSVLAWPGHQGDQETYWDLDYPPEGGSDTERPEEEWIERLDEALLRSVRYRLQADVDVGFYLSGGLDSSLIAALIHELSPDSRRHSFSIGFHDERISEVSFQRLMSERVTSIHHELLFDWEGLAERLPRVVEHCECPIKETYNACSLALSRSAREQGIKVVLTGEGADELFAGYIGYRFDQSGLREEEDGLEALLEREARERLWGDPDLLYETRYSALREIKEALYSEALRESLDEFDSTATAPIDRDRVRGRHPIHQRSYLDFKLRLADHLVSDHGDRMALANSVEARYPFLDVDLVELVRTMPPSLKLRGMEEKYVLKRVAQRYLPEPVVRREKFGFHAPGSSLLLRQEIDWVEDLLSPERIGRQGFFDPDTVEYLKATYRRDGFELNLPFETDLLAVVLTFGLFLDGFDLPSLT